MDHAIPDGPQELTPRPPQREDVVRLCRELNRLGAKYILVGGFAVIEAGYPRTTGDIDLLWRMKRHTHRAKDQGDLVFLRELLAAEGRQPPGE